MKTWTEKTWTDQPDIVEGAPVALNFLANNGTTIEVRPLPGEPRFLVTAGTLFQSQTVIAGDCAAMLAVIDRALNGRRGKPAELPMNCSLVTPLPGSSADSLTQELAVAEEPL